MPPSRYVHLESARLRFGHKVDRLAPYFERTDPLADAAVGAMFKADRAQRERWIDAAFHGSHEVPAELSTLVLQVKTLPLWFDPVRAERGGKVILRSGLWGGLTLAYKSLLTAYGSPAGSKPLTFSGRLEKDVPRRIGETGRFVETLSGDGALGPDSGSVRAILRVRLMHAQVRALLLKSGRWQAADWGQPINQVDMAATTLLFSIVLVEGLEDFGVAITPEEREDVLHLWRGVGWKLGVEDELLCTRASEARQLLDLILFTEGPADEDCRKLAHALLEGPPRDSATPAEARLLELQRTFNFALARRLIGDERADLLGIPRTPVRYGLPALKQAVRFADRAVVATGWGRRASLQLGERYWRRAIEQTLGGKGTGLFGLPISLRND